MVGPLEIMPGGERLHPLPQPKVVDRGRADRASTRPFLGRRRGCRRGAAAARVSAPTSAARSLAVLMVVTSSVEHPDGAGRSSRQRMSQQ